jgi:hypothetical protein
MDIVISAIAHRTGSTLLQRIFNRRSRTLIWGEHGGAITHFVAGFALAEHFSVRGEKEKHSYLASDDKSAAWTARMCPSPDYVREAEVRCIRAFLDTMYQDQRDDHDLIGFKEVRYGRGELELLHRAYPAARFILLVRDPVAVWRSMPDWGKSLDEVIEIYNTNGPVYMELAKRDGFHLVRYEDVVEKRPAILDLLSSLSRLPVKEITEVIDGKKLRSTAHEVPAGDVERVRRDCAAVMSELGYAREAPVSVR